MFSELMPIRVKTKFQTKPETKANAIFVKLKHQKPSINGDQKDKIRQRKMTILLGLSVIDIF